MTAARPFLLQALLLALLPSVTLAQFETATVKGSAARLETDSSDRGQIVNNATVGKLVFRCESFNLLNKTNFQAANSTSSSSAFGTIRSDFPARVIQMALKLGF